MAYARRMDRVTTPTAAERIIEAMRAIGVLLIAFAPLDAAFSGGVRSAGFAIAFGSLGLLLFVVAVVLEGRRHGS